MALSLDLGSVYDFLNSRIPALPYERSAYVQRKGPEALKRIQIHASTADARDSRNGSRVLIRALATTRVVDLAKLLRFVLDCICQGPFLFLGIHTLHVRIDPDAFPEEI